MVEGPESGKAAEATIIACARCRRRKIKCDRRRPCRRCQQAGTVCVQSGTGEKQRPVPRRHVEALESQIASLDSFIQKLAIASADDREKLLADYTSKSTATASDAALDSSQKPMDESGDSFISPPVPEITEARARAGQLRSLPSRPATQFFGGTSAFQLHISEEASLAFNSDGQEPLTLNESQLRSLTKYTDDEVAFEYPPYCQVCRQLMTTFFKRSYYYNMYVYREWFLRDWDAGAGPYYSEVLLYSMCALGARLSGDDPALYALAPLFMEHAQSLLYQALERPDLTTLQALIMLGYLEIGHGKASKGWLFCGMAFRLTHEMGLHLDPNNWTTNKGAVDREILRRVYWTAYVADKQLSLHFGRPPALYPHEADVRNTIRIPYPPEWESLLDTYISPGTSSTAYEDGIALVACLVHQIELSKIFHDMIVDVFENRGRQNPAVAATAAQRVHLALTKWQSELPGKLHWNQWTVGQVPSYVLHLHMLFHTAMTILHRPPRQLFQQHRSVSNASAAYATQGTDTDHAALAQSEDVEICYASLAAILRLFMSYRRHYRFSDLPLDFVHILSTAAGTILMKRFFEGLEWADGEVAKPLGMVLGAMEEISGVWPCVVEIKSSIERTMHAEEGTQELPNGGEFAGMGVQMDGIDLGAMWMPMGNFAASNWDGPNPAYAYATDGGDNFADKQPGTSEDVGTGNDFDFQLSLLSNAADGDTATMGPHGDMEVHDGPRRRLSIPASAPDLGLLVTDEFLSGEFEWDALALP